MTCLYALSMQTSSLFHIQDDDVALDISIYIYRRLSANKHLLYILWCNQLLVGIVLPVISTMYKLQEKVIQVVLPLGTTCVGMPMPSSPINIIQDRMLSPYIASILGASERGRYKYIIETYKRASELLAKVNSIFIYNELMYHKLNTSIQQIHCYVEKLKRLVIWNETNGVLSDIINV